MYFPKLVTKEKQNIWISNIWKFQTFADDIHKNAIVMFFRSQNFVPSSMETLLSYVIVRIWKQNIWISNTWKIQTSADDIHKNAIVKFFRSQIFVPSNMETLLSFVIVCTIFSSLYIGKTGLKFIYLFLWPWVFGSTYTHLY